MKIIGAIQGDVQADFFHSLGEHVEVQHHAPEDFDYDDAINRIQTAEAGLQQVPTNTAGVVANGAAITVNAAAIAVNGGNITQHETDIAANVDEIGELQEFFEVANNAYTGKIAHANKNEIVIENLRAVESAQGTDPDDGAPRGFLLTTGYCTEKLHLLEDGRVEATFQQDDPAENDDSKLYWAYRFGAENGETGNDRHEYDGLFMQHGRQDASGNIRPSAQQTDLQTVTLACSKDKPNLSIEARTKNPDVDIVQVFKDPNHYFRIDGSGYTKASVLETMLHVCTNPQGQLRATLQHDGLKFFSAHPNGNFDNWAFKLGPNGLEPAPNAPVAGDPSRSHASQMGSAVHDAKSVYIGNSRYSYDMTNRTLEMHKLKANHIPVYLQSSTTANDLPSGHNATHMTVNKWIDFARSHLSDDTLDVHDVFPYTNADWDAADAPTPTLTAAYNAMSTDVDTLETEMDDVEADILLKAPKASPTFTTKIRVEGTQGVDLRSAIGGAGTDSLIQYNGGLKIRNFQQTDLEFSTHDTTRLTIKGTGEVQFDALAATTVPYLDANKRLVSSSVTPTQLGYLDATSSVQTQIDNKQATLSAARLAVCDGDEFTAANYSTTTAMNSALALKAPLDAPSFTGSIQIGGTALTSTATELNYCDGVTSAIQTQLDAKEDTINLTASRAVVSGSGGGLRALTVTSDQVGYLGDVTSDLQAQIDAKEDTISNTAQSAVNYTQAQQTFTITGTGTAKRVSLPIVYAWNFTSGTKRITVDWETSQATATSLVECTVFCHDTFGFNNAIGRPRIVEVSGSTNTARHKFTIQTNDTTDHSSNTSTSLTVNLRII